MSNLPMEKATYRARAVGAGFGISSKGNNQIAIPFEIVDHEQFAGESVTWLGHFTEKTQPRTIESLQHLGFESDDIDQLEDISRDDAARLLPNVVEIVCEPEEYDGEWQLKVRWVNRAGAGRFVFKEPLKGAGLKALSAQVKGAMRNARGPQPKPSKPSNGSGGSRPHQPHPNAPSGGNDDVPFIDACIDSEPSPISRVLR